MNYDDSANPSVLIISDRTDIAAEMAEDVVASGGRVLAVQTVAEINASPDILRSAYAVLVDADRDDSAIFDLLAHLYEIERVAIVTELAYLDTVYTAPNVDIIIGQNRAERIVTLAGMLRPLPQAGHAPRVNEQSEELQRITQQVTVIAKRLAELSGESGTQEYSPHAHDPAYDYRAMDENIGQGLRTKKAGMQLNAAMIRKILQARRMRDEFFKGDLFADPAWDMLLDMTAAHLDGLQVSVSSLCIAACVPPTTALRWIKLMTECGIFERRADDADGRRVFVALSDSAFTGMQDYISAAQSKGLPLI